MCFVSLCSVLINRTYVLNSAFNRIKSTTLTTIIQFGKGFRPTGILNGLVTIPEAELV
jgi:hypothetical protein